MPIGAIKGPKMSPEEVKQWEAKLMEEARRIAERCKKELGVKSIKVAIGEEEWRMAKTDECPPHEYHRGDNGRCCRKCRTIGIFDVDDLSVEATAYHEILHILLPPEQYPEWLIELCTRIIQDVEIEWEAPLTPEGDDASKVKEWCDFINMDPLPSREALISIIRAKRKSR